jgi:glucose-1-phosphate thymidylyltransferase
MVNTCGIILAGGNGLRLRPITKVVNKHLLPIYDKPMIFYPLSTLMLAGIRDIAIITRPQDLKLYSELLSYSDDLGISLTFLKQDKPLGIPEAYIIGKNFIRDRSVTLILGDNIFIGNGLGRTLSNSIVATGAKVFAFPVQNPTEYGIAEIDIQTKQVLKIVEKPQKFIGNLAIPGLYFTDNKVTEYASTLKVSKRGELEISELLNIYLSLGQLEVEQFHRGVGWLDAGTIPSLLEASNLVEVLQKRQGLKFSVPDEIAWRNGWISGDQLQKNIRNNYGSDYLEYLEKLMSIS